MDFAKAQNDTDDLAVHSQAGTGLNSPTHKKSAQITPRTEAKSDFIEHDGQVISAVTPRSIKEHE